MARGGFIHSAKGLAQISRVFGSREKAEECVKTALLNGSLKARGQPHLPDKAKPIPWKKRIGMTLDELPPDPLGDDEDIDSRFWENLYYEPEHNFINLERGFAVQGHIDSLHSAYSRVMLRESDLNEIERLQSSLIRAIQASGDAGRSSRRRNSQWNDWIAAIAIAAADGEIHGSMTLTALLKLIDHQLQTWGLTVASESTINPALRAVIDRFADRATATQSSDGEAPKP